MHISNCLHPKKIRNPYTHEVMYVPCGKCEACVNSRALHWVQRLDAESRMHQYVLFFTLTYDNCHLPRLHVLGDCVYEPDYRCASDRPRVSFNIKDCSPGKADLSYLNKMSQVGIPYLNHYDAQCFIKRLRQSLFRHFKKYNYEIEKSFFKFYLCGEYGPKNFRPHFHGILFFDSKEQASCIEGLIRKSWTFGFVDTSFVKNTCNSYVAQYLNCTSRLPAVLRHREIRPFAHYSKCPSLGSMYVDDSTLQQIFDNSSPSMLFADFKKRQFNHVPLWRVFEDRLFPKCSRFGDLSHFDRVALYRVATYYPFESASEFIEWCKESGCKNEHLHALLSDMSDKFTKESPLYRLYFISLSVWSLSILFKVDISTYVSHIEDYYKNVEYEKLKSMYQFQQDYTNEGKPVQDLVWFDRFWLDSVRPNVEDDLLWRSLRPNFLANKVICYQLESYGIDVEKFYSADLTEQNEYFDSLSFFKCGDYLDYKVNAEKIYKDNTKTKKKNDYLNCSELETTNSEIYEQLISRFETENKTQS